ncbi:MAG: hypothetical protein E7596_02775 [Ruminococcaceae bacterium]|nr:hypothetical protein [Oscillospiraceae bacterium]
MKKRLLCLIISVLMILPILLTSCGDDMTPEEIANANFQKADKALTLSLWIPTDAVIDDRFNTRLAAVQASINDYLRSNNYSTELEIVAINENEYYEKLTKRFEEIKENEKTNGKAYLTADKYVNHAVLNEETQIYEMAYPDVLNTQLDIFFVGGYNNFATYVKGGDTYALNEFFSEGKIYNGLFKKIRSIFMESTKIDNKYYAVPNNHDFSENGQYILVNKELFDANSDMAWDEAFDLFSLQDYIIKIGDSNIENVIPYVGTADDVPGIVYFDKSSSIAGSIGSAEKDANGAPVFEPKYLYDLDEYKNYWNFYKTLTDKTYVSASVAEGKTAAVQVISANLLALKEYEDTHYIIESVPTYAGIDSVYSSMFAISSHSADYERSMQILYLLQDNETVRTLLQYGIEDVDYVLSGNGDEKVLQTKDSGYKMNLLYTGNNYRTYPDNGSSMSYWDAIKASNLQLTLHPFIKLQTAMIRGDFSEEKMQQFADNLSAVVPADQQIKEIFANMSFDDFENVYSALNYTLSKIEAYIENAQGGVADATAALDAAKSKLGAATTEEEIAAATTEVENAEASLAKKQETLDMWNNRKIYAEKYATLSELINSDERKDLLDLYESFYKSAK